MSSSMRYRVWWCVLVLPNLSNMPLEPLGTNSPHNLPYAAVGGGDMVVPPLCSSSPPGPFLRHAKACGLGRWWP